jgi:hypothetical protein
VSVVQEIVAEINKIYDAMLKVKAAIESKGVASEGKLLKFADEIAKIQVSSGNSAAEEVVEYLKSKNYPGFSTVPYREGWKNNFYDFSIPSGEGLIEYDKNTGKLKIKSGYERYLWGGKVVINYTNEDETTGTVELTETHLESESLMSISKYEVEYVNEYGRSIGKMEVAVIRDVISALYKDVAPYSNTLEGISSCQFKKTASGKWYLDVVLEKTDTLLSLKLMCSNYLDKIRYADTKYWDGIKGEFKDGFDIYYTYKDGSDYVDNMEFSNMGNYFDTTFSLWRLHLNFDIKAKTKLKCRANYRMNVEIITDDNNKMTLAQYEDVIVTINTDKTMTKLEFV